MSALAYPVSPDAIGATKVHDVTPAAWDGEQKRSASGDLIWDAVISCDLGRFRVRFPARTVPAFTPGSLVQVVGLAVVGWGRSGPYFSAISIAPLEGKVQA